MDNVNVKSKSRCLCVACYSHFYKEDNASPVDSLPICPDCYEALSTEELEKILIMSGNY